MMQGSLSLRNRNFLIALGIFNIKLGKYNTLPFRGEQDSVVCSCDNESAGVACTLHNFYLI